MKVSEKKAEKAMHDWLNADAELAGIRAEKRAKVTLIDQEYAEREKDKIAIRDNAIETLEAFAAQNRDELFAEGKKTVEFAGGKMSFKSKPFKLVLPENVDLGKLIEQAKEENYLEGFLLEKTELDKAGILRNWDFLADELEVLGITRSQEESFAVKPA